MRRGNFFPANFEVVDDEFIRRAPVNVLRQLNASAIATPQSMVSALPAAPVPARPVSRAVPISAGDYVSGLTRTYLFSLAASGVGVYGDLQSSVPIPGPHVLVDVIFYLTSTALASPRVTIGCDLAYSDSRPVQGSLSSSAPFDALYGVLEVSPGYFSSGAASGGVVIGGDVGPTEVTIHCDKFMELPSCYYTFRARLISSSSTGLVCCAITVRSVGAAEAAAAAPRPRLTSSVDRVSSPPSPAPPPISKAPGGGRTSFVPPSVEDKYWWILSDRYFVVSKSQFAELRSYTNPLAVVPASEGQNKLFALRHTGAVYTVGWKGEQPPLVLLGR